MTDFSRLEKNIIDVIKEEQVKLGYRSETIHLYYPLSSLNRFLSANHDTEGMSAVLKEFSDTVRGRLGEVGITHQGERFCFTIPPEGVDYVHQHMTNSEFICDFIRTIEKHGCTIEDIRQVFGRYSDHVHMEKATHGEFDYVLWFEDGTPDEFRYCITDEGCHMIYHRFTAEDYSDFGFESGLVF